MNLLQIPGTAVTGRQGLSPDGRGCSGVTGLIPEGTSRSRLPTEGSTGPVVIKHDLLAALRGRHSLKPSDAWSFVGQVIASPSVRMLGPTERHGQVLVEVLGAAPTEGGTPPGLETAVLLREHGVRELLSADRGMRRFPFLSVRDPVHGEAWAPGMKPARRYRVLAPRVRRG